ncbi:PadR family transcriptional regulator [Luteipulveratus sp. YIM 133132]|uniref:PadR family transcriptional regulator n=1 Tax=Luteipulveratus flavus TaxID=3031728 RepID=UPI0023AF4223|nr:PadR family transcriptional regulator [Luteipulveratus sp. YIM 133132]MDE9365899.1 PadR family transcriptional regulator [Luteipulveratus sp. YIM 133132]
MSPVFAHGQLRLYLLALLADGPRHGYEVMRDLEERFDGLYTPSAGTVYPRLAKLEEEGLVTRTDEGRKATYAITDAGRAEVADRRDDLGHLEQDLQRSAQRLADEVRERVRGGAADLRAELKQAARDARRTARPAGGGFDRASYSADAGLLGEIETALHELRHEARRLSRDRRTTDAVRRDVLEVVRRARDGVQEAARRR